MEDFNVRGVLFPVFLRGRSEKKQDGAFFVGLSFQVLLIV